MECDEPHALGFGILRDVDAIDGELSLDCRSNRYDRQTARFKPVNAIIAAVRLNL